MALGGQKPGFAHFAVLHVEFDEDRSSASETRMESLLAAFGCMGAEQSWPGCSSEREMDGAAEWTGHLGVIPRPFSHSQPLSLFTDSRASTINNGKRKQ